MPAPTSQFTIAKPPAPAGTAAGGVGGILPMSAVTHPQANDSKPPLKASSQRLKVLVRRLPPGLTQSEFDAAIGDEWKPGHGKVSWFLYRPGKVSKDLSKPSRPARAYFQLSNRTHLEPLADKIRNTSFIDASNTANDASLLAPPALEFAPYARVPLSRRRNDARQGLVDQDPEFIAFLESLTDPTPKPPPIDSNDAPSRDATGDPIKVTPLIQHLRDKKAAKEAAKDKEKAAKKDSKHARQSSKAEAPASPAPAKLTPQNQKPAPESPEKKPTARPSKEKKPTKAAVKQSKKEKDQPDQPQQPQNEPSSASHSPAAKSKSTAPTTETPKPTNEAPTTQRTRKATSAISAASIIQRDLGLGKARGGSRARPGRPSAEPDTPVATATANATAETSNQSALPPDGAKESNTSQPLQTIQTPMPISAGSPISPKSVKSTPSPAILKRNGQEKQSSPNKQTAKQASSSQAGAQGSSQASGSNQAKPKQSSKSQSHLSPNATQAFLKHANPSQGITEPLIMTALSTFGDVTKVEIDKRKGFAYVDFADHEGLKKAIAASPVKIAQGSVQVLERKDRPAASGSKGAGGSAISSTATASAPNGRGGTNSNATTANAAPPPTNSQTGGRGGRGGRSRGRGGAGRGGNTAAPASNASPMSSTSEAKSPAPTTASATVGEAVPPSVSEVPSSLPPAFPLTEVSTLGSAAPTAPAAVSPTPELTEHKASESTEPATSAVTDTSNSETQ